VGHARTFWTAQLRAGKGTLVYREDDLDGPRCRREFADAAMEDLRWLGLRWAEGPDVGGAHGPYRQSERMVFYSEAFDRLRAAGLVYPCKCSRRDIVSALSAPHAGEDEAVYPGTCRADAQKSEIRNPLSAMNWRFRLNDGESFTFNDECAGTKCAVSGLDFGDFVVWRKDGFPSYQLACVVDDALMGITEVVRGEDLITSTFRQLALYRALGWKAPSFYHCPLVVDEMGTRLAKRHDALSLRTLREQGKSAEDLRSGW
jgi:glutamyl/glutaminyl-tRNA synthetase